MNAISNILLGIKKAISVLPSKKEKVFIWLFWLLELSTYFITMCFPTIQMWITDGAVSFLSGRGKNYLLFAGFAGLIISALLGFLSRRKLRTWSDYISSLVSNSIYGELLKKSARIKYNYFDEKETYEKILQTTSHIPNKIADLITWSTVPPIIGGFISLIIITLSLCTVHWSIAILAAAGNLCSIYFYYRRMKNNYYLQISQIPQKRWAETYWSTLLNKNFLKEISLFGLFDYLIQKWKLYTVKTSKQNARFSIKYSLILFVGDFISISFKTFALCIAVYFIINGKASAGSFMLVYGSINVFNGYLSDISRAFIKIGENSMYIRDWLQYMSLEEEQRGESTQDSKTQDITIEYSNVSFRYSGADHNALDGLSVTIRQGERIAIAGENGSGKSTFVSLLNGLYDNYEGHILINHRELRDQIDVVRQNTVSTFQDFGCYEFTLKENIQIGDLQRTVSEEEIRIAAEKAGVMEIINQCPDGMDTHIGSYVENGINLSGGQWQKIAFSRALLKADAKVIILDEPTAALDPLSETAIYKKFIETVNNQTTILISHRLGAAKFADRVLVFKEGRIVEDGPHNVLMEKKGVYWDMYTAQSKMYKEQSV